MACFGRCCDVPFLLSFVLVIASITDSSFIPFSIGVQNSPLTILHPKRLSSSQIYTNYDSRLSGLCSISYACNPKTDLLFPSRSALRLYSLTLFVLPYLLFVFVLLVQIHALTVVPPPNLPILALLHAMAHEADHAACFYLYLTLVIMH